MIEIISNSNVEFDKIIRKELHTYNRSKCVWIRENTDETPTSKDYRNYHNFGVYDNGILVGGAVGLIRFGWYFLEELWLNEKYRSKNIGTEIIKKIEKCAYDNKVFGIRLNTWNFQARGFYEKMGYEVYAKLDDCPPGTTDYYLKKILKYDK